MKLYGYWRSSASWRVRIGLFLKGVPFETAPVHLLHDEQKRPSHEVLNPMGQVPVLELDDGTHLTQSLAILVWLDRVYPLPALQPSDPLPLARAWQAAEIVNSGIQPLQNIGLLANIEALGGDKVAMAQDAIRKGLYALESLEPSGRSRFFVGDHPTIADVCIAPQLYNARRFHLDVSRYPRLLAIEEACNALPAFQLAHPDAQPDAPRPVRAS